MLCMRAAVRHSLTYTEASTHESWMDDALEAV